MKLILGILVFFFGFLNFANSQNQVGLPSPDHKFLGRSGAGSSDISIDQYSGRLQVNIPLSSLASERFVIPVSLNYAGGGGIRHQEYAGVVGLGWQLGAGGSITRVVRAFPDEHPNGYLGTGQHGSVIRNLAISNGDIPMAYLNTPDNLQIYDSEPDLFHVNTPFFSFSFTFDENGNVVMPESSVFKIVANNFNNTTAHSNSSFTIVDGNGNSYSFGTTSSSRSQIKQQLNGSDVTYNSVWHLTKITTTDQEDTVYFDYVKFGGNSQREILTNYSWEYTRVQNSSTGNLHSTEHRQEIDNKYISEIRSTKGRITFEYLFDRADIEGVAPRLKTINSFIKYHSAETLISKMVLNTSYFGSLTSILTGNEKRADRCRLRLDNIRILKGPDLENEYADGKLYKRLTYFNDNVGFNRKDNNTDYFGYRTSFSPTQDPMKDPTVRQPYSLTETQTYALHKIIDFKGAYAEFTYGLNTVSNGIPQFNEVLGGLRLSERKICEPDADCLSLKYEYEFGGVSTGASNGSDYKTFLLSVSNGSVTLEKIVSNSFSNTFDLNGYIVGYQKVREIQTDGSYIDTYFNNYLNFPDYKDLIPGSLATAGPLAISAISYAHKRGVVTKSIVFDKSNRQLSETVYTYTSLNTTPVRASYGIVSSTIGAAISSYSEYNVYQFIYYTPIENYRLNSVRQKIKDDQDNEAQTITSYYYHTNKFLVRTLISNDSEGKTHIKTLYYPEDGATIPNIEATELTALMAMTNSNIKNIVVHEHNEIPIVDHPVFYTHNEFDPYGKVKKTSSNKANYGVQGNEQIAYSKSYYDHSNRISMLTHNGKNFKSIMYNAMGDVSVEISNAGSQRLDGQSSNINYEYYYEGFEHTLSTYGSFNTYAGVGASAVPFTVPFIKENTRNYLIDYRYYDSSIDKWIYKKSRYTNNFVISDGSYVDEIRVYPEDAAIVSYTYNIIGLKDSETDSYGLVKFYQYDDEMRLSTILDQDRNILESYLYNEVKKVYENDRLTEFFIKNNCLGDHVFGEAVQYVVPKGKYKSKISQADANLKAEDDLSRNGQLYANTVGNCSKSIYVALEKNVKREVYIDSNPGEDQVLTEYRGDIVIRFYADAAKTLPINIAGSPITLSLSIDNQVVINPPVSNPYIVSATGFYKVMLSDVPLSLEFAQKDFNTGQYYVISRTNYQYSLNQQPGYTVVP